ncbi:MAG: hypothetical protein Q9160_008879 [Pyrenula sp. 1 TL-2023]
MPAGKTSQTIVVIGAGVWGLTTANLLQKQQASNRVAIIASEFPGDPNPSVDYASMWAGAHYRPVPGKSAQLKAEGRLAKRTFETMRRIAREEPEAGVGLLQGVEHLAMPDSAYLNLKDGDEYAGPGDNFRILNEDELPDGVRWGCEYASYCVNVPIYCSWLLSRFIANGGRVIKARVVDAISAFDVAQKENLGQVRVVVNCSGRNFDKDSAVSVTRGQTCLIRRQYSKTVTRQNKDGTWLAVIPRPLNGGTIIGVSKEPRDMEVEPRKETRDQMLESARRLFPDLLDEHNQFDLIRDNVGRRPTREGGARLEVEKLNRGRCIVHGYGAGSRGFELSWGVAERLVDLVQHSMHPEPAIARL